MAGYAGSRDPLGSQDQRPKRLADRLQEELVRGRDKELRRNLNEAARRAPTTSRPPLGS